MRRIKIYIIESRPIGSKHWGALFSVSLLDDEEPALEAFGTEKQATEFIAAHCPDGWEARVVEHYVTREGPTLH